MGGIEGEGRRIDPTAQETKPTQASTQGGSEHTRVQPGQPEQTQPWQGRAEGRESLQGPTTLDGHEPDTRQPNPTQQGVEGNSSDASAVEQRAKRLAYKRKYYQANKERLKEQSRQYYQESKAQRITSMKRYAQANKERIREYHQGYHEAHKEELAAYQRQYYQKRKEQRAVALTQQEQKQSEPIQVYPSPDKQ